MDLQSMDDMVEYTGNVLRTKGLVFLKTIGPITYNTRTLGQSVKETIFEYGPGELELKQETDEPATKIIISHAYTTGGTTVPAEIQILGGSPPKIHKCSEILNFSEIDTFIDDNILTGSALQSRKQTREWARLIEADNVAILSACIHTDDFILVVNESMGNGVLRFGAQRMKDMKTRVAKRMSEIVETAVRDFRI